MRMGLILVITIDDLKVGIVATRDSLDDQYRHQYIGAIAQTEGICSQQ